MDRKLAISKLCSRSEAVRAFGATALFLFGSTVRDEAQDRSDIDIFVEYKSDSHFSLLDLAGIKVLLEEELGVDVDVTTRDSLHPLLRDRIERSAVRIF